MGQINTNNYPTVDSLADADLLIVENATNGTGTTTPKQLRENAIGTGTLQTSAQTVTGAINELKHEIDLGAGVARYDVNTITSGYLGQFSGSANLLLLHLTTDGIADATNGYMMMLSYSRPVARFAYGRLVDSDGVAYKQDVYADNTIICTISGSGEGTESDPVQVVILGIINAGFMLTPTAVVSDRDIIDGQGNTLSVLAEALTKTASGNPVVITDCAGGKARSLITEINAIQDLHGYDKPWVGGAGKNKFDGVYPDISSSTVQYRPIYVGNGTYTISTDCPKNSAEGANIFFLAGNAQAGASTQGNGVWNGRTITVTTDDGYVTVAYRSEGNVDPTNYNTQIESGSQATSFAPYSNICPISGRTAAVITRSDGDEISEDFTIQLGQTVYGGSVDFTTGVATITHKNVVMDGVTARQRFDSKGGGSDNNYYFGLPDGYLFGGTARWVEPEELKAHGMINSHYPYSMGSDAGFKTYVGNGGTVLQPRVQFGANSDITTVALANQWLQAQATAGTPFEFNYPLATPIELTLTPTQLQMLKGYNRVTIDNGSIELGYIAKLT
jgi:hypothetical protein